MIELEFSNCCFNISSNARARKKICWMLGEKCNHKCKHCSICADYVSNQIPQELSDERIRRSISSIDTACHGGEKPGIIVSGGEPLVYEDYRQVCKALINSGYKVSIATNGFLLAQEVETIREIGVGKVIVSLDSYRQEVYNDLRGIQGAFTRTVTGIKAAIKAGIDVSVCCYVFDGNIHELADFFRFVSEMGIQDVSLSFPIRVGHAAKLDNDSGYLLSITKEESIEILNQVINDCSDISLAITACFPYCATHDNCPFSGRRVYQLVNGRIAPCIYDPKYR